MATKAQNLALLGGNVDASGEVDSNTVDGIDSSQFLRSDTSDTFTGKLTVSSPGWGSNEEGSDGLQINATSTYPTLTFAQAGTPQWSIYNGAGSAWVGDGNIGFVNHTGALDPSAVKLMIQGNGRVGIGTTAPGTTLHVDGGSGGWAIFERNNKQLYVNANYSGQDAFAQLAPRGGDYMDLSVSSADSLPYQLYLKRDGMVGIGTNSPVSLFHVQESAQVIHQDSGSTHRTALFSGYNDVAVQYASDNAGSVGTAQIFTNMQSETDGRHWVIQHEGLSNSNRFGIGYWTTSSDRSSNILTGAQTNEFLTITTAGNIGIGTTAPNRKLTIITNDADVTGALKVSNGGTGDASMFFQAGSKVWAMGIDNSDEDKFKICDDLQLADVGTDTKFTIDASGRVGIGTSTPTSKLTVNGNLEVINSAKFAADIIIGADFGTGGSATIHRLNDSLYLQYNNGLARTDLIVGGGGTTADILCTGNIGLQGKDPEANTVAVAIPSNSDGASTLNSIHLDGLYSNGVSIGVRSANSRDQLHFGQSWNPGSGTKFKVDITNGRATVGNGIETHDPSVTLEVVGTDAIRIPAGTTAQRPSLLSTQKGYIRFNSDTGVDSFEYWDGTKWRVDAPLGSQINPATSIEALAAEQSVNGTYYFNIGGSTFTAYVVFNDMGGKAWMHVGTISDNNEARNNLSNHPWGYVNDIQSTPFDDGSTFGTQSFTSDFKHSAWNTVPFKRWGMKDQGATLRNLFYSEQVSTTGTFDDYWGTLTWRADGSDLANNAYSAGRVDYVNVTNYGVSDPCLLGDKPVILLKWGERNGVQDTNRDRAVISGHAYNSSSNVDAPMGLGCFTDLSGVDTWRDIVPNANSSDAPPNSISGAPLNYTLWITDY